MAKENSFDIVSRVNMQEVLNAVNQAEKEIQSRFDFKGSKSKIVFDGKPEITLHSDDDFKLKNVIDILEGKLVKRGVNLKALRYGKVEPAAGDTVRQVVTIVQGIEQDIAKKIIKAIKDSKIKVQASIQGDQVRVSGKNRDDLQAAIAVVKGMELNIPVEFTNYRTF
ncbi:YajQ family cyclic di-GMP-binding protein [Desulforamulus ferrireducens]|uniref:Nucleotide-binding protein B0537_09540 n=1 Tax=Desulforamulus ferrireducens TaxID=1833852 RepID=A0A1S6IX30_9FIRM|nr:YajQ family cyclic di-GMP-binding protein [Desulforamulus ferrireducens]AQS59308.1 YajQ family cyclic di-GMP-binding protein [Desulforamulus ferrireducens]